MINTVIWIQNFLILEISFVMLLNFVFFFSLCICYSWFYFFYYLITLYFFNYPNFLFMFLYYSIVSRNIHIHPFCDSYFINFSLHTREKQNMKLFSFLPSIHLYNMSCILTKVSWFILMIIVLRMNSKAYDCDQHYNLKSKEV